MGRVERGRELARRRKRRDKLKKLRQRYVAAKGDADKHAIEQKVRKMSPFMNMELFAATKSSKTKKAASTK
jgi:hypothetical protein